MKQTTNEDLVRSCLVFPKKLQLSSQVGATISSYKKHHKNDTYNEYVYELQSLMKELQVPDGADHRGLRDPRVLSQSPKRGQCCKKQQITKADITRPTVAKMIIKMKVLSLQAKQG